MSKILRKKSGWENHDGQRRIKYKRECIKDSSDIKTLDWIN